MSETPERPVFSEGQVLAAADLNAGVEYARGQLARHHRYLHTWGIAHGLELSPKKRQTEVGGQPFEYVDVYIEPGLAIDGSGREIVVAERKRLSEDEFDQFNVAVQDPAQLYPVFLHGLDERAAAAPLAAGGCTTAQSSRTAEGYGVSFGGPDAASDLDSQAASAVTDGPGGTTASGSWQLLLGFVKWDKTNKKFTAVEESSLGARPRYAGVLADEVAARGGRLLLRTRPANESGQPALVIEEGEDGPALTFGLLNASGVVTPGLTVTATGDVTATGKLKIKFTPGSTYVQTGVATDGMILPLPPGVKPEDVGEGDASLHVQATPRLAGLAPPITAPGPWVPFPLECSVDDERRVRCLVRWVDVAGAGGTVDRPGACDYSVTLAVPAAEEGTT